MQKLVWRVKLVADLGAGPAAEIEVAQIAALPQPPLPPIFRATEARRGRRLRSRIGTLRR
jgi:hypothetical protein